MQCRIYKNSFQQMEVEKFELLDTNNFHNIFVLSYFKQEIETELNFFHLFLVLHVKVKFYSNY